MYFFQVRFKCFFGHLSAKLFPAGLLCIMTNIKQHFVFVVLFKIRIIGINTKKIFVLVLQAM